MNLLKKYQFEKLPVKNKIIAKIKEKMKKLKKAIESGNCRTDNLTMTSYFPTIA